MTRSVNGWALGRFDDGVSEFAALVVGDRAIRLQDDGLTKGPATIRALLDDWAWTHPRLADLAASGADGIPLAGLRTLAPVEPRQILQAGANYRSHVAQIIVSSRAADDPRSDDELRRFAEEMMDERARTGSPFFFSGMPAAICGPDDDVLLPSESAQVDWEAELAVVIGAVARRVPRERALDYVAGYTVCNDISARDLQFPAEHKALGGDWVRAKNRPTFLPTGPFLVPADQVGDHRDLEITFDLNGERLQQDLPRNMLFDVPTLIAEASAATTLYPGDLILTGSPAGNGGHYDRWLRPGDVMVTAIAGLGAQRNTCVPE
ncbi:fumarylacetoacetate hydrolase family protein [Cryptosporangium aurantiacum]|uniref:2-keto-4-pentenoate hydratase/2-oxohepta-3-ene-1,7-dioic acid hydratase (Catechol pathway) n=1 Tax=Cryptosporangium aurantiacum TaxID=134849 RepID=A0A1M7RKR1_9ACTN|nr:fumarylacetoacetate hydrolase family protein [Cryptosporangium aurantiacum]SHN46749.1 2-keto-4-pentenoate hydratase/2-oxohepta-3-ene-1,7-dioic acid hydratase (catechol pathway) [Cryptosporangium aurantiacum]